MESKPTTLVSFQEAGQSVEVRLDAQRDTVWLSHRQLADLFETSTDNISLHLKNIFAEEELSELATAEDSSVVQTINDIGLAALALLIMNMLAQGAKP